MFLLIQNVLSNRIDARFAHAERAVAGLPREILELRPTLVNPPRGVGLYQAGYIRNGVLCGHSNEDVYVIGHSVDAECDSADFADDASDVGVEILVHFLMDQRISVTSAEDEMD